MHSGENHSNKVYLYMDLARSIRLAVDSGKVTLGAQRTLQNALRGEAKLIIVAKNCPPNASSDLKAFSQLSDVRVLWFEGSSLDLGTLCGKPFPVSALSVIEEGDSDILSQSGA